MRRPAASLDHGALAGLAMAAWAATVFMHVPGARSRPWVEPAYLGTLGAVALAVAVRAVLLPRFLSASGPLLLVTALLLHAVPLVGMAPPGSDLAISVSLVAVSALTGELLQTWILAALLGVLHLVPAWLSGALDPGLAVTVVLPLGLAALPVALLARDLKRRRQSAEVELRRVTSLHDRLESLEEDSVGRIATEEVDRRRMEATMQLDGDLGHVLKLVKRTLGATRALLFDLDRGAELLRLRHAESEVGVAPDASIAIGKGPVGWVALRGMTYLTPERRAEPSDPGYCGGGPAPKSVLACAIKGGELVTGVLAVDHLEPGAFGSGDGATLEDFARWIEALVESTGVLRQKQEEAEKFRALHDASQRLSRSLALDELVAELLALGRHTAGFDRGYVLYREDATGRAEAPEAPAGATEALRVLASGGDGALPAQDVVTGGAISWGSHLLSQDHGFILDLAGERRPMPLLSEREGKGTFRSVLGVPIRLKGETVGGILIASRQRPYRAREQQLLEILANQAAYAVDNARLYKRMEEMATTDGLTGLYNHRFFQQAMDREMERAERGKGKLALALMDIDFFKKLNDTHGHPAGDEVLRGVARVLRQTARKTDIVARYGGEEFVAVLIDTDGKRAGEMAERIRSAIKAASFHADGTTLRATVSIGIASYPDDAKVKSQLIDAADKALYFSKQNGRDQWNAYGKVKDRVVGERPAKH